MATTPSFVASLQGWRATLGSVATRIAGLFKGEPDADPESSDVISFTTAAEARTNDLDTEGQKGLAATIYERMQIEAGRLAAYRDYDLMDAEQPELSTGLDVIAEFSTQSDDAKAETFNVHCDDQPTLNYITDKVKQFGLQDIVTQTAREVAKYGHCPWEIVADTKTEEVVAVKPLPPKTIRRKQNRWGQLEKIAFVQMDEAGEKEVARFAAWQIVHGRYLKTFGRMYGNSQLEPIRRVYKQLQIAQDNLVIQRVYRANQRYVFQIPVDGLSSEAAEAMLKKKKRDFGKRETFNPETMKMETSKIPIGATEDFFIGVRKEGVNADVKVIQGQGGLSDLGDIQLLRNSMFAGLGVPKGLLAEEEDLRSRSVFTEQNAAFARKLRRMQQVVAQMVRETIRRVMILDGMDPDKVEWTIVMPPISTVDDLRQWQIEALKANVALIYGQKLPVVDKEYIWTNIMEISAEDVDRLSDIPDGDLGVKPLVMPAAFGGGGFGGNNAALGNAAAPNPMASNRPSFEAELDWDPGMTDDDVVLAIRRQLQLFDAGPITEEERKCARMLREFQDQFGSFSISEQAFAGAFLGNGNGRH